jgi:hypothetical protein
LKTLIYAQIKYVLQINYFGDTIQFGVPAAHDKIGNIGKILENDLSDKTVNIDFIVHC